MPKIFKLNFSSPAALPVVPLTPPPVPIPELWNGLQAWFDPSYGVTTGQFPANHPGFASRYFYSLADAANRVRWKDPAGAVRSDAIFTSTADVSTLFTRVTSGVGAVNGRPSLQPSANGSLLVAPLNTDPEAELKWASQEYTYLIAYRATAGATGGLLGTGDASFFGPANSAGLRFGFESGVNSGKTLFQHSAANRLLINRNTATDAAVLAIITCSANNAGNVTLRSGGATTVHSFAFNAAPPRVGTAVGWLDDAGGVARSFSNFAKWNRKLTDAEVASLITHMSNEYGPF